MKWFKKFFDRTKLRLIFWGNKIILEVSLVVFGICINGSCKLVGYNERVIPAISSRTIVKWNHSRS